MSSGESCNDDGDDDTVHCHDGLVKRNAIEVAVLVPFLAAVILSSLALVFKSISVSVEMLVAVIRIIHIRCLMELLLVLF